MVTIESSPACVRVVWSDGEERRLSPLWLRDNCPSRRHASTGQKLCTAADLPTDLSVNRVEARVDSLHIEWAPGGEVSEFCSRWLRSASQPAARWEGRGEGGVEREGWGEGSLSLPEFDHAELSVPDERRRYAWMRALFSHGAALIRGVPQEEGAVRRVAECFGPIQPQIYGELFDVRSERGAINLAYTSEAIGPHMDLCYYEACGEGRGAGERDLEQKRGKEGRGGRERRRERGRRGEGGRVYVRFLHCMRFDPDVCGGESFLIDGFAVAERLRVDHPSAFAALSQLPATFVKDHSDRPQPVLMSYLRPHLALSRSGALTGVFWSPPFEGPLQLPLEQVAEYYTAYRLLSRAIDAAPRWQHRLQPGDLIAFNNRRMLHGRNAFNSSAHGSRWLRGCYVNIDEFSNRFNLLDKRFGEPDYRMVAHGLGNQDWGRGCIGIRAKRGLA
ncbi:MAG: hypothetical protein SGPRY_013184 [Prymnesium sp.]